MSDKDISDPANADDPPPDAPGHGTGEEGAAFPAHAGQQHSDEASLQPTPAAEPDRAEVAALGEPELPTDGSKPSPGAPTDAPADSDVQLAFEFTPREQQSPGDMASAMEGRPSQPGSCQTQPLDASEEELRGAAPVGSEVPVETAPADERTTEPAERMPVCQPSTGFEDDAQAAAVDVPQPDRDAEPLVPASPAEVATDANAVPGAMPACEAAAPVEPVGAGEAPAQPVYSAVPDAWPAIEAATDRNDALDRPLEPDFETATPEPDFDRVISPGPVSTAESNSAERRPERPLAPVLALSAFPSPYGEGRRAKPRTLLWDRAPSLRSVLVRLVRWLGLAIAGIILLLLALILLYRVVDPPVSALMVQRWLAGGAPEQTWVPLERISPQLVQAVIVSEDARFCQHWGIDLKEIEAALERAREGAPRGASTISMQVAKNLFLWPAKSYLRKAIELPLTLAIELFWPKRRILEVYLNIAEWGPEIFGAEAAARHHFGKPAARLGEREAALLAVSLPDPHDRRAGAPGPGLSRLATTIQLRMRTAGGAAACVLSRKPKRPAGKL